MYTTTSNTTFWPRFLLSEPIQHKSNQGVSNFVVPIKCCLRLIGCSSKTPYKEIGEIAETVIGLIHTWNMHV